jgi:hypothetical protein
MSRESRSKCDLGVPRVQPASPSRKGGKHLLNVTLYGSKLDQFTTMVSWDTESLPCSSVKVLEHWPAHTGWCPSLYREAMCIGVPRCSSTEPSLIDSSIQECPNRTTIMKREAFILSNITSMKLHSNQFSGRKKGISSLSSIQQSTLKKITGCQASSLIERRNLTIRSLTQLITYSWGDG